MKKLLIPLCCLGCCFSIWIQHSSIKSNQQKNQFIKDQDVSTFQRTAPPLSHLPPRQRFGVPVRRSSVIIRDNDEKDRTYNPECRIRTTSKQMPAFLNCSDIHQIQIGHELGHGTAKRGFLGKFRGIQVVVKIASMKFVELNQHKRACMKEMWKVCAKDKLPSGMFDIEREDAYNHCVHWKILTLVREIFFLNHFDHPGFVKLLGYCFGDEIKIGNVTGVGIVGVFEKGSPIPDHYIFNMPWKTRVKYAIDISELLVYLQNTTLGSVLLGDICTANSMILNDTFKLSDIDGFVFPEKRCEPYRENATVGTDGRDTNNTIDRNTHKDIACPYGLPCRAGCCVGYNAKVNMYKMWTEFFKYLLNPSAFPVNLTSYLVDIQIQLKSLALSADGLRKQLLKL